MISVTATAVWRAAGKEEVVRSKNEITGNGEKREEFKGLIEKKGKRKMKREQSKSDESGFCLSRPLGFFFYEGRW